MIRTVKYAKRLLGAEQSFFEKLLKSFRSKLMVEFQKESFRKLQWKYLVQL